jgi:hypothetical protein
MSLNVIFQLVYESYIQLFYKFQSHLDIKIIFFPLVLHEIMSNLKLNLLM